MCLLVDQTSFLSREEQGHARAGGAPELCPIPHAAWATWMDPLYSPTRPLPTLQPLASTNNAGKLGKLPLYLNPGTLDAVRSLSCILLG